jgi:hypothetical protein
VASSGVSEEHIASIFRVKKYAEKETSVNAAGKQRRFGGTYRLHLQSQKISRAGRAMEAVCSSETSVDIQRITRRYIPEDGTLHNHRCENLKSYILVLSRCLPGVLKQDNVCPHRDTNQSPPEYNSIALLAEKPVRLLGAVGYLIRRDVSGERFMLSVCLESVVFDPHATRKPGFPLPQGNTHTTLKCLQIFSSPFTAMRNSRHHLQ